MNSQVLLAFPQKNGNKNKPNASVIHFLQKNIMINSGRWYYQKPFVFQDITIYFLVGGAFIASSIMKKILGSNYFLNVTS